MPPMYKDARDWFSQNASEISLDQLIGCVLNNCDNDDIGRWFGVNMDDDCDNPGAGTSYCENCRSEVNDRDYDSDLDMCKDCASELEEESEDAMLFDGIAINWHSAYSVLCPRTNAYTGIGWA